jgi:hypothetical protein
MSGLPAQTPTPAADGDRPERNPVRDITERKLRRRQLTEDGNVEITGRDLRERSPPIGQDSLFETGVARVL